MTSNSAVFNLSDLNGNNGFAIANSPALLKLISKWAIAFLVATAMISSTPLLVMTTSMAAMVTTSFLCGGLGSDILTGANGRDKFVFAAGKGSGIITDFCKGNDWIGLSGGLTFNQLSFTSNNIIVAATNEILATPTAISSTTLTAANFTIL